MYVGTGYSGETAFCVGSSEPLLLTNVSKSHALAKTDLRHCCRHVPYGIKMFSSLLQNDEDLEK